MICPRCGANVHDGATFCPKCGLTIQAPAVHDNNYNNGGKNTMTAVIVAVIAIVLLAVVFMFMMVAKTGPFKPESTPSPEPAATSAADTTPAVVYETQQSTASSSQSQSNVSSGAVLNPSYGTFTSSEYGFSIAYPSHFAVYDDGGTVTLYTVQSYDGTARELIAAEEIGGETVSSSMSRYIMSHSGTITYQTSGSDYYAVNMNNGTTEYYKYCKFKNGNMYWFEFIYPAAQHDVYDMYVNDIYNSLYIY